MLHKCGVYAAQLPCKETPHGAMSPGIASSRVEEVRLNQVLLTLKPGFCHFFFQMIVFHDKNTMCSHCSALLPLVPDKQNDNSGQPLNLDTLYGSVTKTAPILKTVLADS